MVALGETLGLWAPVALLIVSLLMFWLSTRQFHLGVRLLIWLLGAVALVAAAWVGVQLGDFHSLALLREAGAADDGAVRRALDENWDIVDEVVPPMLAVFVIGASLLAVATLIGFTPGQAVERLTRPLITFVLGGLVGGLVALVFVALGFGGYFKPRNYMFQGAEAEIIDGDTIRVGDTPLRLIGIDALELDQTCADGSPCGANAAAALEALLRGEDVFVVCTSEYDDGMPPEESFGRPLVDCRRLGDELSLGDHLRAAGWAVEYTPRPVNDAPRLIGENCTLHPQTWRRNRAAREEFAQGGSCPNSDNPR